MNALAPVVLALASLAAAAPASKGYAPVDGLKMYYEIHGEGGTPLVLLHGLEPGRSMAEWRGCLDLLADHHTVYALDWLGWGLSDAAHDGCGERDQAGL